jgi:transcriptional antiterminator RfaH
MLKFEKNPPMLTPTVNSVAELVGPWWVGHTKARFEKAFAGELLAKGIPYFLPMVERVKVSGGRKRRLMLPLFTSYVFFCGDLHARYQALTTDRLCQAIPVSDCDGFVAELASLETTLKSGADLELYSFATVGRRCRVRQGPLLGVVGTVMQRDKKTRLVLRVSILGQGASLEIDIDLLEPVD